MIGKHRFQSSFGSRLGDEIVVAILPPHNQGPEGSITEQIREVRIINALFAPPKT